MLKYLLLPKYIWLYFKITLHSGLIWGIVGSVEINDARLETMYPKEWKQLKDIQSKFNKK